MDGQYLGTKPINVAYALKKDGGGERHGSETERTLAAQRAVHMVTFSLFLSIIESFSRLTKTIDFRWFINNLKPIEQLKTWTKINQFKLWP